MASTNLNLAAGLLGSLLAFRQVNGKHAIVDMRSHLVLHHVVGQQQRLLILAVSELTARFLGWKDNKEPWANAATPMLQATDRSTATGQTVVAECRLE